MNSGKVMGENNNEDLRKEGTRNEIERRETKHIKSKERARELKTDCGQEGGGI